MASMEEREFNLWLEVRVEGYGTEEHEEKVAQEVERLLRVRMGDRISVSLVRDSDKVDTAVDTAEGGVAGPDRCEVCKRGEPEWQSGKVIYRCVKCGAAMNVPEQPSGGTLGRRMRGAGWQGGRK